MIKNFANSSQIPGGDAYDLRQNTTLSSPNIAPVQVPAPGRTHILNDRWMGSENKSRKGGKRSGSAARLQAAFDSEV